LYTLAWPNQASPGRPLAVLASAPVDALVGRLARLRSSLPWRGCPQCYRSMARHGHGRLVHSRRLRSDRHVHRCLSLVAPASAAQAVVRRSFANARVVEKPVLLAAQALSQNRQMTGSDRPKAEWSANHFSQANPKGPGQADVPALLRRVAETIRDLGDIRVVDLVMHNEVTPEGNWPSIVVYYHRPG